MPQQLNQVPPNLEVWEIDGHHVLVRPVTEFGLNPPIYLWWDVASSAEREALGIKRSDRVLSSWADFHKTGAIAMGNNRELANTTEDPVDQILSNYETEVRVKPWLADPEILGLWTGAALEGRSITDAELQGTEWWRTHSEAERQWLRLSNADPATADQMVRDRRAYVAELFRAGGVNNASVDLINVIADQWTQGAWTETHATNQIRLLADPHLTGDLDPLLKTFRDGLDSTQVNEDVVDRKISEWLGPMGSQGWTDEARAKWASRLREDPDAEFELTELLKRQRQSLFPEYKDMPDLTYEDIVAPWRGVWTQVLGQRPDETSSTFFKIVRSNDMETAEKVLRNKGITDGNARVVNDLVSELGRSIGGQVRRADPAVR